jgi:hypothetical protein
VEGWLVGWLVSQSVDSGCNRGREQFVNPEEGGTSAVDSRYQATASEEFMCAVVNGRV